MNLTASGAMAALWRRVSRRRRLASKALTQAVHKLIHISPIPVEMAVATPASFTQPWDEAEWQKHVRRLTTVLSSLLDISCSLTDVLHSDAGARPSAATLALAMSAFWEACARTARGAAIDRMAGFARETAGRVFGPPALPYKAAEASRVAMAPTAKLLHSWFPAALDCKAAGRRAFDGWIARLEAGGALLPGVAELYAAHPPGSAVAIPVDASLAGVLQLRGHLLQLGEVAVAVAAYPLFSGEA